VSRSGGTSITVGHRIDIVAGGRLRGEGENGITRTYDDDFCTLLARAHYGGMGDYDPRGEADAAAVLPGYKLAI
jgi:hypothetical protein